MRGSRTLLVAVGALAGLVAALAASAAGFSLSRSTSTSTASAGASAPPAAVLTPNPTATSQVVVSRQDVDTALFALAAGGKTLGGPGHVLASANSDTRIYQQAPTVPAVDACVTLRNLSSGEIRVSANGATLSDVGAGQTNTACFGGLVVLDVSCRQGAQCEGVWRVDRL